MDDVENLHVGFKHSNKGDKRELWYNRLASACDTLAFAYAFWKFVEAFNLRHDSTFDSDGSFKSNIFEVINDDAFKV